MCWQSSNLLLLHLFVLLGTVPTPRFVCLIEGGRHVLACYPNHRRRLLPLRSSNVLLIGTIYPHGSGS